MNDETDKAMAKLARIEAENGRRQKARRDAQGLCACGHKKAECRPEICSHRFARDAMWGN